jgi:YD repeat-containing protein
MITKSIIFCLLFVFHATFAQSTNISTVIPTIVKPSPTTQNFMRYGEIPFDFSTGVPQIEIPLHTISGKKINLPLSISYHASGIKVSDMSSEVGIGWVLNAGGLVSRTMFDVYDEDGANTKTYSSAEQFLATVPNIVTSNYNQGCNCYMGSHNMAMMLSTKFGNEDLMNDRYFYRLPDGRSGIFRYNYPTKDTLITLPYRPHKINKTLDDKFKITDENGTLYIFQRFQDPGYGSSEWFLKEIISSDETEHITLNYIQQQRFAKVASANTLISKQQFIVGENCDPQGHSQYPIDQASGTGESVSSTILSSIESNDETITFSYADREDFQLKKIVEIKIFSKINGNKLVKKVNFNQSYFGNIGYSNGSSETMDKRLKLNSVDIYGESNSLPQTYSFTYEQSIMLPPYISRSFDFWGYYNGINNGSAVPRDLLSPELQMQGFGGDRKADNGQFSKACMIREIKYPTGGKSKFDFERAHVSGLFNSSNSAGYIGGFRVSKITNYSKDNEISSIKSYQYSDPNYNLIDAEFYGYLQRYIDNSGNLVVTGNNITGCWEYYTRPINTSIPVVPHDLMPGLPIAYSTVYEYQGTVADNNGWTEYSYSFPNKISYTSTLRELHSYQEDKGNYEPKLVYKRIKSKSGNMVSDELHSYSDHYVKNFKTGINVTQTMSNLAFLKNVDLTNYGCANCVTDYIMSIKAHNTTAVQSAYLKDYSVYKTYDSENSLKYVRDSISYIYNQHNLMLKETSKFNSIGQNITQKYKYPYDYAPAEPYQSMLAKNILTPLLEQITTNNNIQISKNQVAYKNWGDNIIEPEIVKTQGGISTPLENRIRYLSYDKKGNVLSLKKEDATANSYLWGYNKALPIAMVENSSFVSQSGVENQDKYMNTSLYIPMGNTTYELGTFTITEEKNYKIERTYEKIPNNYSVMYNISFKNLDNPAYSVLFTDTTPSGSNSHTFTTPAQLLKPGNYQVNLTNVGYNGYQGMIEHLFNIIVYNPVNIERSIPFHTSFEEDRENVSEIHAKTGVKSHIGQYIVRLPQISSGYDKVIVSYWGKSTDSSPWEYVEDTVTVNGQNINIGSSYYFIDEVRVYPVGAMMSTYTYDPFYREQTSVMKPNGQTEYYNYDAFGRLKEVYIMEGNVKKTLRITNYHYKP